MMKVRILDRCEFCDGEIYLPGEDAERSSVERCYLPVPLKKRFAYPVFKIGIAWVYTGAPQPDVGG